MIFLLVALLMTGLAGLIVAWPLRRARRVSGTADRDFNQSLRKQTLRELTEEVRGGDLDPTELEWAQRDALDNIVTRSGKADGARAKPLNRIRTPAWPFLLILILAAPLLFLVWGNWRSAVLGVRSASRYNLDRAIDHFADHLKKHPTDLAGWKLYARAEIMMGHYAQAAAAYATILKLPGQKQSASALAGYGECLVLEHPNLLDATENAIFNHVLKLRPNNSKALWYGGLLALAVSHDRLLALTRFRELLELGGLPPAFTRLVAERIIALGGRLPVLWEPRSIGFRIGREPTLAGKIRGGSLFVLVRTDSTHSPPLWVKQVPLKRLPVMIRLRASDAMQEKARFGSGLHYRLEVRWSPVRGEAALSHVRYTASRLVTGRALKGRPVFNLDFQRIQSQAPAVSPTH
jgi:cytochrome c-type biogenesis protein CcmH